MFNPFVKPLPVGSQAPDFTTQDDSGKVVSLNALRGKNLVLVFYPADDTSLCTAQLCEFRDRWSAAQAKNTLVYGVNPADAPKHTGFRKKYDLPFPLIVDTGRKLCSLFATNGLIVKRTVYLIGPDGKVRFAQRGKPSVEEVLASAA